MIGLMEEILHHLGGIKPYEYVGVSTTTGYRRISEPSTVPDYLAVLAVFFLDWWQELGHGPFDGPFSFFPGMAMSIAGGFFCAEEVEF